MGRDRDGLPRRVRGERPGSATPRARLEPGRRRGPVERAVAGRPQDLQEHLVLGAVAGGERVHAVSGRAHEAGSAVRVPRGGAAQRRCGQPVERPCLPGAPRPATLAGSDSSCQHGRRLRRGRRRRSPDPGRPRRPPRSGRRPGPGPRDRAVVSPAGPVHRPSDAPAEARVRAHGRSGSARRRGRGCGRRAGSHRRDGQPVRHLAQRVRLLQHRAGRRVHRRALRRGPPAGQQPLDREPPAVRAGPW